MKMKRNYREKKTCSAAKTKQKHTRRQKNRKKKKFIQKMKRRIIINKHDNCNQFLNSYDKNRTCFEFDLQN